MEYKIQSAGEHMIIGNDDSIKIEVRKDDHDEVFNKTPYMRVFDGESYDTSSNKTKISLINPSYLIDGWRLNQDQVCELNKMMHSGERFSSPWFTAVMEASREYIKARSNGEETLEINFLNLRDSEAPDFTVLSEGG